jgi:hypothetical protein
VLEQNMAKLQKNCEKQSSVELQKLVMEMKLQLEEKRRNGMVNKNH